MENVFNAEILQIIEAVSREKGITKSIVIDALQDAIQASGRKKYGNEHDIRAKINQTTGEISLYRVLKVVDNVEDHFAEIALSDAKQNKPDIKIGDEVLQILPPIDLGRVAAQTAKHVIVQKIMEAERQRQYEEYKNRKGEVLNGTVKRIESSNIIVDLGRAEAILRRDQQIRGEMFKVGDRIKAYVKDVRESSHGPQIILSRTDNAFLEKLFEIEVPEIYKKVIEVKAVARDPGSKAKVAVFAPDVSIDPIGSCVGVRGARVGAITDEVAGEKIDVILWDKNIAQFVINAMTPAKITKIVFDEESGRVEVVVPDEQLNKAIGKGGQNVRLASKLTGFTIDVMSEEEESKRRSEEFTKSTALFTEILNTEEVVAQLLASEGYNSIEQIASADNESLLKIEGFTEELVSSIQNRAAAYIEKKNAKIIDALEELGVEQELLNILDLPAEYILKLAESGIKNIEDLAETTVNEFKQIVPEHIMNRDNIETLIQYAKEQTEKSDE